MKWIFCLLAGVCLHMTAYTQTSVAIKKNGLQPGERLPDVTLKRIYNYPKKEAALLEMQEELTILDFWATWCATCVESFSKMEALQDKYKGRLKIVMVNSSVHEDEKKVSAFLERRKERTGLKFSLSYLLQDSVLNNYFPHQTIPHCVWLDKERMVVAITEGRDVNEANLDAFFKDGMIRAEYKNDALRASVEIDGMNADDKEIQVLYGSWLTGEQKGRGRNIGMEPGEGKLYKKMRVLNYSLLKLYQMGFRDAFKYGFNRIVPDSNIAVLFEERADEKKYCYQIESQGMTREAMLAQMGTDLEKAFRITADTMQQLMACYVLKPGKAISQLITKGGERGSDTDKESIRIYIRNEKPTRLCSFLQSILKMPVVDETGMDYNIDLEFPRGVRGFTVEELKKFLETKGIVLERTGRMMWVTRLKEINNNN